jgi:GntR family transcriptional regulator, carbon starvation induced regulator
MQLLVSPIEEGFIVLDMLSPKLQRAEASGSPLLTDLAWKQIRDDIICGKLKPDSRLRIAALRKVYSIGASPIREALSKLVADGFVISLERRGFVVAPVSLRELRELTEVRKLIEKEAVQLSIAGGDETWEANLVAAEYRFSKLNARRAGKMGEVMREWETVNELFFDALFAGCASMLLQNFRRTAYAYAKRYMRVCLSGVAIRRLYEDNAQIAEAASARNGKRASSLLDSLLERTFQEVAASGKLATN